MTANNNDVRILWRGIEPQETADFPRSEEDFSYFADGTKFWPYYWANNFNVPKILHIAAVLPDGNVAYGPVETDRDYWRGDPPFSFLGTIVPDFRTLRWEKSQRMEIRIMDSPLGRVQHFRNWKLEGGWGGFLPYVKGSLLHEEGQIKKAADFPPSAWLQAVDHIPEGIVIDPWEGKKVQAVIEKLSPEEGDLLCIHSGFPWVEQRYVRKDGRWVSQYERVLEESTLWSGDNLSLLRTIGYPVSQQGWREAKTEELRSGLERANDLLALYKRQMENTAGYSDSWYEYLVQKWTSIAENLEERLAAS